MTFQLNLRFQKQSDYGDDIFICSNEREPEQEAFKKLKSVANQLTKQFDTFLPVYHSEDYNYCSIRFKAGGKSFKRGSLYNIKFDIKQKTKDDKKFVNCFVRSSKLIKSAKIDDGELITFE
jgi:hypothetical protein